MKVLPLIKKYKLLIIISIIVILALILGLVFNKQTDGFEDAKYDYEEINNKQPVKPVDQTINKGFKIYETTDDINDVINDAKEKCNSNAECKGFYIGIDSQSRPFYRLLKSTENKNGNPNFSMNKMFIKKEIQDVKTPITPLIKLIEEEPTKADNDKIRDLINKLEGRKIIKKVLEIKKNNNPRDKAITLYFFKFINNNNGKIQIAKFNANGSHIVIGGNRYTTDKKLIKVYPVEEPAEAEIKDIEKSTLKAKLVEDKDNKQKVKIGQEPEPKSEKKTKVANLLGKPIIGKIPSKPKNKSDVKSVSKPVPKNNPLTKTVNNLNREKAQLEKQLKNLQRNIREQEQLDKQLSLKASVETAKLNNNLAAKSNLIKRLENQISKLERENEKLESSTERQQTNTGNVKSAVVNFDLNFEGNNESKTEESFVGCSYSPVSIKEYFDAGEETPLDLLSSYFDQRAIPIINEGSSAIDVTDYLTRAQVEKCYKKCLI